jgi:hypothetical protein
VGKQPSTITTPGDGEINVMAPATRDHGWSVDRVIGREPVPGFAVPGHRGIDRIQAPRAVDVQGVESDPGDEADVGLRLGPPPPLNLILVESRVLQSMPNEPTERLFTARLDRQHRPAPLDIGDRRFEKVIPARGPLDDGVQGAACVPRILSRLGGHDRELALAILVLRNARRNSG